MSRSSYTETWQAYRDALRQAVFRDGQWHHVVETKSGTEHREFLMDDNMRNTVTLILAGLAKKHGGQVVIPLSDLGEVGDQISVHFDQVTGLVTITHIPDYVKIGTEEPKSSEFYVKWDTTGLSTGLSTTTTNVAFDTSNAYTLYVDGKEVGTATGVEVK